MTIEILEKMQERKRFKGDESQTGKQSYLKLKQEIQRMRRKSKDDYYNEKCKKNRRTL